MIQLITFIKLRKKMKCHALAGDLTGDLAVAVAVVVSVAVVVAAAADADAVVCLRCKAVV